MRAFFGNNCAKGCLIYIFAFALLVVVSSMGLSRLGSKFGDSQIQGVKPDLSVPQAAQGLTILQSGPASLNQDTLDGGLPPATAVSAPPTAPPAQASPLPTAAPPPPEQGQGGTISGGTSQPFYIVQPGDTLWAIAQKFGISIDALRAANKITGDTIYPGEVIYLPVPEQSALQSTASPGNPPASAPPDGAADQGQSQDMVPGMPDTGITSRKP